ncbi:MAG: hypothetical protein AAGK22_10155 [Acidobacteriota bacterium]
MLAVGTPLCLALALLWGFEPPETSAEIEVSALADVRGITLSTHRGNREWDSDQLAPTLADLRAVGANWVAIHPYASVRSEGGVRRWETGDEAPSFLARPLRESRAAGLRLLVKPHLAYWGSPFAWRGEIEFQSDEAWNQFFAEYEEWIVDVARWSRGTDAFVVGTELDRTLHREADWRRIIERVRSVTDAPLTYAANWTDYQRVPFWDALDAVGVQGYFPLSKEPSPTRRQIEEGWRQVADTLGAFSRDVDKPVLFTELGYNRSLRAAAEPWSDDTDGPEAEALQLLCLEVALRTVEREEHLLGAFLWKWFLRPRSVGRDFQMASPAVQRLLRQSWKAAEVPPAAARP